MLDILLGLPPVQVVGAGHHHLFVNQEATPRRDSAVLESCLEEAHRASWVLLVLHHEVARVHNWTVAGLAEGEGRGGAAAFALSGRD